MLFDLIFAVAITAASAAVTATLSFTLAHTPRGRLMAAAALSAWFVAVVILGVACMLLGVNVIALGVAAVTSGAVLSWLVLKAEREAQGARIPTSVLIGAHAIRVLGVSFLLLHAAHRLPAPFAVEAGWGDVAAGVFAAPLALFVDRRRGRTLALAWSLLGSLDLIAAIGLGATSSPGPIRLFLEPPGSGLMTTLPWILIPAFLVPSLFALHVAIFRRLRHAGAAIDGPLQIAHA